MLVSLSTGWSLCLSVEWLVPLPVNSLVFPPFRRSGELFSCVKIDWSLCLSVDRLIRRPLCLCRSLPIAWSLRLFFDRLVSLYMYRSTGLSVCQSAGLSVRLSTAWSLHLYDNLLVSPPVCQSLSVFFFCYFTSAKRTVQQENNENRLTEPTYKVTSSDRNANA